MNTHNTNLKIIAARIKLNNFVNSVKNKWFRGDGEFSRRIKLRNTTFWNNENGKILRNTIIGVNDPIEKLKDADNWQRKLSNKYNSREFAKKHGCKVPELYWRGRDINKIPMNDLPKQFVIRPTIGHSCNHVFLINDEVNLMDRQVYSKEALLRILAAEIKKNAYLEFLIEEFLKTEQEEYKIPIDYKFFMFGEEVATILVVNRLMPPVGLNSFYDINWKRIKTINNTFPNDSDQKPPDCLNEMIECSRKLGKAYETFVRIDFYATDKGAIFGEFTPTPGLGKNFTKYGNKLLGDYWNKVYNEKI